MPSSSSPPVTTIMYSSGLRFGGTLESAARLSLAAAAAMSQASIHVNGEYFIRESIDRMKEGFWPTF